MLMSFFVLLTRQVSTSSEKVPQICSMDAAIRTLHVHWRASEHHKPKCSVYVLRCILRCLHPVNVSIYLFIWLWYIVIINIPQPGMRYCFYKTTTKYYNTDIIDTNP